MSKLFTPESDKAFNRIIGIWLISIIFIGMISDYLNLSSLTCDPCNALSELVPSIDRMSSASPGRYPHGTRLNPLV